MGVFDWVKYECDCPQCGNHVDRFQTKDGSCHFEQREAWQADKAYAQCKQCKAWVVVTLTDQAIAIRDAALKEVNEMLTAIMLPDWFSVECKENPWET